jgi:polyisoprenoid-binding protein YceI
MTLPVKSLAGIFTLTLLFACKPKDTAPENPVATQPAPAAPVAAAPAAPATPAPTEAAAAPVASAATAPATIPAATPAGAVRYEAQSTGSKMTIAGTSTIHDWTMESVNVGGYLVVDAKFPESATDASAVKPVASIFIPVRTLKSYAKKMDQVMQEHMKEPTYKKIEYNLIELKPKSPAITNGAFQFDAIGALTIAGVTKTNSMPVTIEKVAGTKLKVSGATAFKMSEYGVKPPAPTILGMPTISTGDEIKLAFEWLTAPKAP